MKLTLLKDVRYTSQNDSLSVHDEVKVFFLLLHSRILNHVVSFLHSKLQHLNKTHTTFHLFTETLKLHTRPSLGLIFTSELQEPQSHQEVAERHRGRPHLPQKIRFTRTLKHYIFITNIQISHRVFQCWKYYSELLLLCINYLPEFTTIPCCTTSLCHFDLIRSQNRNICSHVALYVRMSSIFFPFSLEGRYTIDLKYFRIIFSHLNLMRKHILDDN